MALAQSPALGIRCRWLARASSRLYAVAGAVSRRRHQRSAPRFRQSSSGAVLDALGRYYAAQSSGDARARRDSLTADPLGAECERFIRDHERRILNYLWRMTGDEEAAYDLTQEVFVRAWQRFATIRTYERPESWLFRVATNLALTHLRRRGERADVAIPLDNARDPGASDPGRRLAESELVRRVLLGIAPRPRAALVLREVYGLSGEEIARTLGMSASAVRVALHRA